MDLRDAYIPCRPDEWLFVEGTLFRLPRNTVHGCIQPAAKYFQYNQSRRRLSIDLISTTSRSPNHLFSLRLVQSHCMSMLLKNQGNSIQSTRSCPRQVTLILAPFLSATIAQRAENCTRLSEGLHFDHRTCPPLSNHFSKQTFPRRPSTMIPR
jgi:hypothetical protein